MELRKELLKYLGLSTFIVVDLETTGLEPENNKIIEVGAIKFVDGEEAETFEHLVNPGVEIPEFITRLTGISDKDVADAPPIEKIFPELDRFLGGAPFVGHQVNFDASFIEYQYRVRHNDFENWQNPVQRFKYVDNVRMDTLFLSRILLPFLPKLKLGVVAKYFGYDIENAHRAIEDARATGHIFLELIDRALAVDNKILSNIINLLFANSVRAKTFFVPVLKFKKENNITVTSSALVEDVKHAQQYYNIIGQGEFGFDNDAGEKELYPVDEQVVDGYFQDGGKLADIIPKYELREQQNEMAGLINNAFNHSEFLIAEAGTGTGKSMAYLVPAVEWAAKNRDAGQRVIISTNTKNLQEQLFFKDIPTLYSARKGRFKAVLLKGRSNYLCVEKWNTVMTDMNQRLSQDERSRILPLVLWAEQTRTGDIAENMGFQLDNNLGLWQKLIAEPSYCPGRACKFYSDCFLMKARENARQADLVIVNHALLFSDLAADHSILGEYRNLIVDEAHNIEKTAAEHLGIRVSYWSFRNLYHKLYEEEPKKTGTILQLEYRLSRGNVDQDVQNQLHRHTGKLKRSSTRLKQSVLQFYNEFAQAIRAKYQAGQDDNRIRYYQNFRYFRDLTEQIDEIKQSMSGLSRNLSEIINEFDNLDPDRFEFQDQLRRELVAVETDINALSESFDFCLKAESDKYVYWLDLPRNERINDVTMHAVPLNIADLLRQNLYESLSTAVFTSATLAVEQRFDYFVKRTGLTQFDDKKVETAILGSPFNYKSQLMLAVTDFIPDPRSADYSAALFELIKDIHKHHQTGMLVLFTSYSLLNLAYESMKPHFEAERILLLAQGKSGSRTNILNQFKEYRDSILFGTDSFWEGVDVPGDALEILFIPKLPFDVPTEPLIAARMDEIKKQGGNAFFDYSVPEAIIKFRQGFGRLIRTKSDFGAVIIADNRLSKMQYGKQFLSSLPVKGDIYFDKRTLLDSMDEWFLEKK